MSQRFAFAALSLVVIVWAAGPSLLQAQANQANGPVVALQRYLGTWTYEGDGNGGRVTCRSERRWIANGAFVESHRDCMTPNGPISQVEVFGYNARRGLYLYWGFSGNVVSTYTSSTMAAAAVARQGEEFSAANRCTETFAADGRSSTDMCETSPDGGRTWRRVSGGRSVKVE